MGIYINPVDNNGNKQNFKSYTIAENSEEISSVDFLGIEPGLNNRYGVIVVNNGLFEAAAIAYSNDEAERFVEGLEGRPARYFSTTLDQIKALDEDAYNRLLNTD